MSVGTGLTGFESQGALHRRSWTAAGIPPRIGTPERRGTPAPKGAGWRVRRREEVRKRGHAFYRAGPLHTRRCGAPSPGRRGQGTKTTAIK
nr:MAG TPA: hypothetical protein [Caudoviricetes sp.]